MRTMGIDEWIESLGVKGAKKSRPPKVDPILKKTPKAREIYWCKLPKDAQLPEFWKTRPVIIVSFRNTLRGTVTVIPCTSQDQKGNIWAVPLKQSIDSTPSWAVCDKPMTVAVSRLYEGRNSSRRIPVEEFNLILGRLLDWLPKIPKEPI